MPKIADCLAERGGFESSSPFISQMLPRFHAHFPSRRETLAGKSEVQVVHVKLSRTAPGVVSKDWL
jgi:hypothetical protein